MARVRAKGTDEAEPGGINETIDVDGELNALFMLPLTEFTAARNALIRRLKQSGCGDDVERVKALVKPPISAWAVNQLYWKHRNEFDGLVTAGEHLSQAHAAQLTGKAADVRGPMAAKRQAVSVLMQLASKLMLDAGHNSTPDAMRRIETTLEALSASAALLPGRLTDDVGALGFEAMAGLVSSARSAASTETSQPLVGESSLNHSVIKGTEDLQARHASARGALESAEQALREFRRAANKAAADLKNATDLAAQAEESRRRAEDHLAKASAAAEVARQHVQDLEVEVVTAGGVLQNAERAVEEARKELQRLEKRTSP